MPTLIATSALVTTAPAPAKLARRAPRVTRAAPCGWPEWSGQRIPTGANTMQSGQIGLPHSEDARRLKEELGDVVLGGERDAVQIEGFDLGASPREFLESRASTAILSTTN